MMSEKDQFLGELFADCHARKPQDYCMPFGEYLLIQFINGRNVELDVITNEEYLLLDEYDEQMLVFTPITNFMMSYALYDKLCENYANQPLLRDCLAKLKTNSNLKFIGAKNAN